MAVAYVEVALFPFYCRHRPVPADGEEASNEEIEWHLVQAVSAEAASEAYAKSLQAAGIVGGNDTAFSVKIEIRADDDTVSTWTIYACLMWSYLSVPKEET